MILTYKCHREKMSLGDKNGGLSVTNEKKRGSFSNKLREKMGSFSAKISLVGSGLHK